jgi:hypothetical protein
VGKKAIIMIDALTALAAIVVGLVLLAACVYILGFLVSMVVALFWAPAHAAVEHSHHTPHYRVHHHHRHLLAS